MLWALYSLISAFGIATADAFTKKSLGKSDDYIVMFSRFAFTLPFVLILLFFIKIPKISPDFWNIMIILIPLEVIAAILYIKAIKISPLSLTLPFLSFTPLFLIFVSFLLLNELPDTSGMAGIAFIVIGAYLLNAGAIRKGLLEPIKSIAKERGSVYMIIVAFLYSILSTLGKIAVHDSSPLFFAVLYPAILTLAFSIVVLFKSKEKLSHIKSNFKSFIFIGFFLALSTIFHFLAIIQTIVPYMISVKRTSLVFAVLYGHFMFKEKNTKERLTGTIFMFIGVILITLF